MKDERPTHSRLMIRFLRAVCPEHLFEEIEGDLIEKFNRDSRAHGVLYSKKI
jgi:putative ABC transport system permease protein